MKLKRKGEKAEESEGNRRSLLGIHQVKRPDLVWGGLKSRKQTDTTDNITRLERRLWQSLSGIKKRQREEVKSRREKKIDVL